MSGKDLREESESINQDTTVKWMQRLKEESWEAELLVSAIAIFGTFQLFGFISWVTNKFIDYFDPSQYFIGYLIVFLGLLAVSILASMFVIHFVLRAYWVGLVGLNSVFPDYSVADSAYSEIYTKRILAKLPKLKDSLQKVDELSSVIFSAAFYILLTYAFMALVLSGYLFTYNLLIAYLPNWLLLAPALILGSMLLLHLILSVIGNAGKFKRHQRTQLALFHVARVVFIITTGPLYKYLLQISMIFVSNFKKKKDLVVLVIVFGVAGAGVAIFKIDDTNIPYLVDKGPFNSDQSSYFDDSYTYPDYYQTENQSREFLLSPEIDSDVIKAGVLKMFIPIFKHERGVQAKTCGLFEDDSESEKSKRARENAFELNCYHQYHQVLVNDQLLETPFIQYRHPRTKQMGILGYIDTQDLALGQHTISVKKTKGDQVFSEWNIPFYYLGYSPQR